MSGKNFIIENLHANIDGKEILRGIDLEINSGEIHALMGPNGSGKSTLANVIMGHPQYEVTQGKILFDGVDILELETDERARMGVFLAFQYPVAIPGVTIAKFLKRALESRAEENKGIAVSKFIKDLRRNIDFLEMDPKFINRYLNEGFSGGEKKRMEVIQMLMTNPRFAILDETDSGLDIDALKIVAKGVNKLRGENFGAIVITHYQRILDYLKPNKVHIIYQGRIVKSGDFTLSQELEEHGYDWIKQKFAS